MKAAKRTIALAAICTVLTVSAPVYAQNIPVKEKTPVAVSTQTVTPVYSLNVNGEHLNNVQVYKSGDRVMIPLRSVFEKLGFKVVWNGAAKMIALEKMPIYITLAPGTDGYTFAKTAPLKLGKAPEIVNGVTYVPVEIVSQILKADLKVEANGSISISYTQKGQIPLVTAKISKVSNDTVTINDPKLGEVVLHISSNTVIEDQTGKAVKVDALQKDMSVEVEYSPAMTASMPPQNSPLKIKISQPTYIELDCQVNEVRENQISIIPNGKKIDINNSIVLNISKDTQIVNTQGQPILLKDIKVGMKLHVQHSQIMTMSIPPQTPAIKIIVQ